MQNILILATGGTIASDITENGLAPELTAADIVSGSLHNLQGCHIDCRDILSLDSSNIQPEEWSKTEIIYSHIYPFGLRQYNFEYIVIFWSVAYFFLG